MSGTFPLDVAAERLMPADVDRVWNAVAAAGWAETCTEWEDRRVTLRFAGGVKLGLLGRLVVAALSRRRPAERILDAYERDLLATGQPH